MKTVLICPDRRSEVAFLARTAPLALTPILGPSLLSHWLTALADRGARQITLLASDRPDQIRAAVGNGERWGLHIDIQSQPRELSIQEALAQFGCDTAVLADRLPAMPDTPLFQSVSGFFEALQKHLPTAHKHRVGTREVSPGIWAGLGSKIDPSATLSPPCWLGEQVWIRAGATVGPGAIIEDSAIIDHDAETTACWIGPWTYTGALTRVHQSLAWSDGLLDLRSGFFIEIIDAFLMCDLRGSSGFSRQSSWLGRFAAVVVSALTSPLLLLAAFKNRSSQKPLFEPKRAVIPTAMTGSASLREMHYSELNGLRGLARRWPQLWSIARGDFTWVGNRPITRSQAAQLETEFEQLWLSAPVGLVSLADAFGCGDSFDDDTRAHSSFYSVRSDRRMDIDILRSVASGRSRFPTH
ncbi:MAG: sugar transferase [Verrucomicrobia bacterium]|nr:sugar transferase [Verrucomicrobiota bacterium]